MKKNDNLRLCGGTFFLLVLQALKPRFKAKEHYHGKKDGLSDPEVLIGLIKVINPDYQEPQKGVLKGKTNDFKSCKDSTGVYFPFGDTPEIETFDERVRNDYRDALEAMTDFAVQFLELGTRVEKDKRLVKALIDLVQRDGSIEPEEEFYIEENGGKIKKAAFGDLQRVCLPAFLLGIWHYVVVNRKDNTIGRDTYDSWCPENNGGPRPYTGDMGKQIKSDIDVYMPDLSGDAEICDSDNEDADQSAEDQESQNGDTEKETPPPAQQIMNNPLFISQTGEGSTVIPNYGTINLTLEKKGREADGQ